MAIVIGSLSMGTIERVAGCFIATRFTMINGVPLRPIESFIELGPWFGGRTIPIPLNRRSVLAGYLRVWLSIAAAVAYLVAVFQPWLLAVAVPLTVSAGLMWMFYGRLSPSERRRRLAYAMWLGAPCDPIHAHPDVEIPCLSALCQLVDERCADAPSGYRAAIADAWRTVAVDSDDPELLVAALTRARLERLRADAADRPALDALHAALWSRLDPMLTGGKAPPAFIAAEAYVARDQKWAKANPRLLVAAIAAAVAMGVAGTAALRYDARPTLAVVNVSGNDGMTVYLDGEPLAERMPTARRENDGAFVTKRVKAGQHEVVTRDASGVEIDRRRFLVTGNRWNGTSHLYVPVPSKAVCFYRELVTYSASASGRGYDVVRLDMTEPLLPLRRIDHWFDEAPRTVESSTSGVSVERRTVRAWPCSVKLPR